MSMQRRLPSAALASAVALILGSTAFARGDLYVDSAAVSEVQQTLNTRGFEAGPVDGIMGPATRSAVRQFQQSENLESTGQLNRQTLEALGMKTSDAPYSAATVRAVQDTLGNRGYYAGSMNGKLDDATRQAVREFQASENLETTGQLNRQTLDALGVIANDRLANPPQGAPSPVVVRQVQEALTSRGYRAGPTDGIMGPQTRSALLEFQRSENLEASGRLNRQTLTALGVPTSG